MSGFGLFVIFGLLAIPVGAIVTGAMLKGGLGAALVVLGIVGCVAWVAFAFYIASAMNSDI